MNCDNCDISRTGNSCFECQEKITDNSSVIFIEYFNEIASRSHCNAVEKGWWKTPREPGTDIANLHAEISEAWEAYRNGNPQSKKIPNFSKVEEELADEILRIMDIAGGYNLRVAEAMIAKIAYNVCRPERHGGKLY